MTTNTINRPATDRATSHRMTQRTAVPSLGTVAERPPLRTAWLGRVGYRDAWELQEATRRAVLDGSCWMDVHLSGRAAHNNSADATFRSSTWATAAYCPMPRITTG